METQRNLFDEVIDRKNTYSLKHDFAKERKKPEDILPLWVADMDFRVPEGVSKALEQLVQHGIFGYSEPGAEYAEAVCDWFSRNHHWEAQAEWLVKSPGVVFALSQGVKAFTRAGDAVMIQQPVYYPFAAVVEENNRRLINNELIVNNGRYEMDFTGFEKNIVEHQVKLFILCSPHNPVGRVWTVEELTRIGEICLQHGVYVISDEIHCDFTYAGYQHTMFSSISQAFSKNCMLCTAPSKTFNLAGLQISNIFIEDSHKRQLFKQQMRETGYGEINPFGLAACKAAYETGEAWLASLRIYLEGNLQFMRSYLKEHIPQIKIVEPEGTYLVWLDCSELGLSGEELENLMVWQAKLWLDGGCMFGKQSDQYQRINITSPQSVIQRALEQLEQAVCKLYEGRKSV